MCVNILFHLFTLPASSHHFIHPLRAIWSSSWSTSIMLGLVWHPWLPWPSQRIMPFQIMQAEVLWHVISPSLDLGNSEGLCCRCLGCVGGCTLSEPISAPGGDCSSTGAWRRNPWGSAAVRTWRAEPGSWFPSHAPRRPHQPFSLKGHNQPRQMRPRLLHEDMAQESHFPSSGPTLSSFLAPRNVGKKELAKETKGGDWGMKLACSESGLCSKQGTPVPSAFAVKIDFSLILPLTLVGLFLSQMCREWGFQRSKNMLKVTRQTPHLKPDVPGLKALSASLPSGDLSVLVTSPVFCKKLSSLASEHPPPPYSIFTPSLLIAVCKYSSIWLPSALDQLRKGRDSCFFSSSTDPCI